MLRAPYSGRQITGWELTLQKLLDHNVLIWCSTSTWWTRPHIVAAIPSDVVFWLYTVYTYIAVGLGNSDDMSKLSIACRPTRGLARTYIRAGGLLSTRFVTGGDSW